MILIVKRDGKCNYLTCIKAPWNKSGIPFASTRRHLVSDPIDSHFLSLLLSLGEAYDFFLRTREDTIPPTHNTLKHAQHRFRASRFKAEVPLPLLDCSDSESSDRVSIAE